MGSTTFFILIGFVLFVYICSYKNEYSIQSLVHSIITSIVALVRLIIKLIISIVKLLEPSREEEYQMELDKLLKLPDEEEDQLELINKDIDENIEHKNHLLQEIQWFKSNNEKDIRHSLDELISELDQVRKEHASVEIRIAELQKKQAAIKLNIRSIFNHKNWFAEDQIQFRSQYRELKRCQRIAEKEKRNLSAKIEEVSQAVDNAQKDLNRYLSFDLANCEENIREIEKKVRSLQARAVSIAKRKESFDRQMRSIVDQLRRYEIMKQKAEERRERAIVLDAKLESAQNSYERAMIHRECQREFNVGSPWKVIADAEREIQRIERGYEKLYKRAMEIKQKASR